MSRPARNSLYDKNSKDMKKKYMAPTVVTTKCQLLGFITASGQGGDGQLPDEDKKPVDPDSEVPDQHAKWNTGWGSDWDTSWED